MKLFDYGYVQLLFRDQKIDISTPARRRHSRIEQGLNEGSARETEPFGSAFARAVAALNACGNSDFSIGPHDGTEDEPLPGRFFEARFRLRDRGIFVQRCLKDHVQCDRIPDLRKGSDQSWNE